MKIWFDISNSPHINLFEGLIRDLQRSGHEVVISCRPLANTVDLLELHGLEFEVVGDHYGKQFAKKALGYPIRVAQLMKWLRGKRVDLALSQSSFHSPMVARLLGLRSIYMNDNEHALGNVPSFLTASTILVPEFLSEENLRRQWASARKVVRYPGVKEGIYLWALAERLRSNGSNKPERVKPSIYIRPEPWTAQYYAGSRNFLDDLLEGIQDDANVTLLPRGKAQGSHYRSQRFSRVHIVDTALDISEIAPDCDLFVGAGGTMTREMAVLGIPTISVYQDKLLDVDRFLLGEGAFQHIPNLTAQTLFDELKRAKHTGPNRKILDKGKAAYQMLREMATTI